MDQRYAAVERDWSVEIWAASLDSHFGLEELFVGGTSWLGSVPPVAIELP